MSGPSEVIVLAEDDIQQRFVRPYLLRLGVHPRAIINERLAAGRGSGEQRVRQRYAKNVRAYRARNARARTALVVAVDADNRDVNYRFHQLRDELASAGERPRSANEKIVLLVPKPTSKRGSSA